MDPAFGRRDHLRCRMLTLVSEDELLGERSAMALSDKEMRDVTRSVMGRLFGHDPRSPPRMFGRYELIGKAGPHTTGQVFWARDPEHEREVAVKILSVDRRLDEREHLLAEADAMTGLAHPNVITVFEVGEHDGRTFVAMERFGGVTLSVWQQAQPRTWMQTVAVYRDAARGLAAAHERGIVHCDFNPAHVLIDDAGVAKVTDFGITRPRDRVRKRVAVTMSPTEEQEDRRSRIGTTTFSNLSGMPDYMAPESIRGLGTDALSDQFGFSISLYEALHGERPFVGRSVVQLVSNIMYDQREPVPESGVPARVMDVIERGLRADKSERFASMDAVVEALERCLAQA